MWKHATLKLFLSVYVDDFKLVGRKENRDKGWKLIRTEIDLDDPTPFGDYLGCGQHEMQYQSAIHDAKYDLFLHFFHRGSENKQEETPSVFPAKDRKVAGYAYCMTGFAEQCVERYLELANVAETSLRKYATPCIDDTDLEPHLFEEKGQLAPIAARVVLKILFLARQFRYDLLFAVNTLARDVTKWTTACDRRLHRLSLIHISEPTRPY